MLKKMKYEFTNNELYELMWSKPSFAQLEVTRNCNQSCKFCFDGCDKKNKYLELPIEKWKYVLSQLYKMGVKTIHYSGGESYLYRYFIDLLKYTKELGYLTHVNTNGTIDITKSIPYVDEFVFSIHGIKEKHDNITQTKGSFNLIEKNLRIAEENHIPVEISTVIIKDNFNDILDIYHYLKENFSNITKYSFTLAAYSLSGIDFNNCALNLDENIFQKYLEYLKCIGREHLTLKHGMYALFDYDINSEPRTILHMPVCAAGKDKIIVKYNGDIYPCNYFQSDQYKCGNIFEEDIEYIWNNGKGYAPFRKLVCNNELTSECDKCVNRSKCYGGCRIWTYSFYERGNFSNERDFRCKLGNAFVGN